MLEYINNANVRLADQELIKLINDLQRLNILFDYDIKTTTSVMYSSIPEETFTTSSSIMGSISSVFDAVFTIISSLIISLVIFLVRIDSRNYLYCSRYITCVFPI